MSPEGRHDLRHPPGRQASSPSNLAVLFLVSPRGWWAGRRNPDLGGVEVTGRSRLVLL